MPPIAVYTKPACVQCNATFRALDKAGIAYIKIDVSHNPAARDYLMKLGHLALPVVYVSPTHHWSGFRPDAIDSIALTTA
ncbi:MAG: glutaredoxin-like protein NrdH [Mycobacteriaceae bacterium]|nr:glutaredoxin-like protein NrdH [Mycobacteriaceae bacterium]